MDRTPSYFVIVLVLGGLIVVPASSGLSGSSAEIGTSGTIQYPNNGSLTPINKATIIYDRLPTLSEQSYVAAHFTLLDTEFGIPLTQMQASKALNPNLKVIGYKDLVLMKADLDDWAMVNAHEDWFMHDVNGTRCYWSTYNAWGMNPANLEWRAYFVNYINTKIAAGGYDGVFLDDVWVECYFQNVPSTQVASWHDDVLGFLQYIKTNLAPGKFALINSNEYSNSDSRFINAVGAGMIEMFVHPDWWPSIQYQDAALIMLQIDRLYIDSGNGHVVWCLSGTKWDDNSTEKTRMLKYCYAGFLLGLNGNNAYWSFLSGSESYFPLMDTDMGSPTNVYYSSQNVYMRDYTRGKVLFNPSANSYNVILGQDYSANGVIVSNITLGPWSGEILLSQ